MAKLPFDKSLLMISLMDGASGVIESRLVQEKVCFSSSDEMLFRIQQILDIQKLPQSSTVPRRFCVRRGSVRGLKLTLQQHDPAPQPGAQKYFWLVVRSRSYSDWQGIVCLPGEDKPKSFSSIIGLARLLGEANVFS